MVSRSFGVRGFFVHEERLFAYGRGKDKSEESTEVVVMIDSEEWLLFRQYKRGMDFFRHNNILYAATLGGTYGKSLSLIYTVSDF